MTTTETTHDLLVGGFVPPRQFRNAWQSVRICMDCHAVMAVVVDQSPDSPTERTGSWTTLAGNERDPCPVCGFYKLPTATFKLDGDKQVRNTTFINHVCRAVARYNDPFVWWNPLTWTLVGQWELREEWINAAENTPAAAAAAAGPDLKLVPNPEPPEPPPEAS